MFKHSIATLLLLAVCVAFVTARATGRLDLAAIQPRLLLFNRRQENAHQQPIIIVQPNNNNNDRPRHHYWPDYYPYGPEFRQQLYRNNEYPSIIIINPNNAQGLTFPTGGGGGGSGGNGTTGRSGGFRSNPILSMLEGLNAQDEDIELFNVPEADAEPAAPVAGPVPVPVPVPVSVAAPLAPQYGEIDDQYENVRSEDELALLERQAARGLTSRNLLSYLLQDKRRRRFQEAAASVYLRNYNQNRK